MNCPRDNEELKTHHCGGVDMMACPKCGGIWIQREDFEEALETNSLPIFDGHADKLHPNRHDPVECPLDHDHQMLQQEFLGIQIDTCPEHEGIWLDGGELARMQPKVQELIKRAVHDDVHEATEALFPDEEHHLVGDAAGRFARLLVAVSRSYGEYVHWMMP